MADSEKRDTTSGESSWDRCVRDLVDEVQFIVCDVREKNILVTQVEKTCRLPCWFSENAAYRNVSRMKQAAKDIFGAHDMFTVLRCVWKAERKLYQDKTHYRLERSVVVLECQQGLKELPKGFHWVSIADTVISHSDKEAMSAIKEDLEFLRHDTEPELRVAWARLGWYKETTKWMSNELRSLGWIVTKPIVQVSVSPWGTVLRANTKSTEFYLKASPCFCDEAAINDILSSVAPLHVAKPVLRDEERRIFIARDYGECLICMRLPDDETIQMLRDLSQLQKASVNKVNELRDAGVPVYKIGWLANHLDDLLDHEEVLLITDSDRVQKLRNSRESILAAIRRLADLSKGLPMTLVHGDLLISGNVYRAQNEAGRFGFFDWDCAFISHPFFDVVAWGTGNAVTDAYLKEWVEFQPISKLREALPLVHKVGEIVLGFRALYELRHMEDHCRQVCRSYLRIVLETASSCF